MRELLARGADVNARSINGKTAMLLAGMLNNIEALRELLECSGASVDTQDSGGLTPLMRACAFGHLAAAALLLDRGANVALLDNIGISALRIAKHCVWQDAAPPVAGAEPPTAAQLQEHRDLVKLLEARGAT